jgi:alkanesulfonate monooxygenase SsuD/methylene tetrahydromethanopterin reductase-like flavin-dependent oxidoreductase (luciferase family)
MAGRRGIGAMGTARTLGGIREAFAAFRKGACEAGRDVPLGQNVSIQFMTYVAPTMEEAERDVRSGLNAIFARTSLKVEHQRPELIGKDETLTDDDLNCDWFDFLTRRGVAMIGTPEVVAEWIEQLQSELNFGHFQIYPSFPFLSFEQSMRSLELFGTKVMPRFAGTRHPMSPTTAGRNRFSG